MDDRYCQYASLNEDPRDLVMLVKQFISDQHLVQSLICLPHDQATKVPLSGPSVKAVRNTMAPEMLLEYKKTAAAVDQAPWSMHKAAPYFREWCSRSELQLVTGSNLGCYARSPTRSFEQTFMEMC